MNILNYFNVCILLVVISIIGATLGNEVINADTLVVSFYYYYNYILIIYYI